MSAISTGSSSTGSTQPNPIAELKPMTGGIVPITDQERQSRLDKARRLMGEAKIDAIVIEATGSSMYYFTGVRWGPSERNFAVVIPARADLVWLSPKFEEDRAQEMVRFGRDIRTWEEDECPYALFAGIFSDLGISHGRIGIEEQVRFFTFDGIRRQAPHATYVSADPVTIPCRSVKSPAEIALMQRANDITVQAYKVAISMLREGMTKQDFQRNATAAHTALGVQGSIGASFGEQSSLPHGSDRPRQLREGDIVLMDGGCLVEGYRSDISRTIVFGQPTAEQLRVWDAEIRSQRAAFEAARPGVPHQDIDAAARRVQAAAGFGPGYRVPGLPHRTGHGIGLDVHEWTYLVKGNTDPVQPGMCFTNEPMIVIPGRYGIRQEDAMYITENGARFFTEPSESIDRPFR